MNKLGIDLGGTKIEHAGSGEQDSGFNNSRNAIAILNHLDIDVLICPFGQFSVGHIVKIFLSIGTACESFDPLSLADLDRELLLFRVPQPAPDRNIIVPIDIFLLRFQPCIPSAFNDWVCQNEPLLS